MDVGHPTGVRVEFDVPARMRDGTVLYANIYRPADETNSFPVLLMRTPYGKDLPMASSVLDPVQAARRGYVVVIQDVRGCFTSEGEWFPLLHEQDDGADTLDWLAQIGGTTGTVAMYGASYFAHTQWAAAVSGNSSLRAMIPLFTWADADSPEAGIFLRGGAHELGLIANWTLEQGLDGIFKRYRDVPADLIRAIHAWAQEVDQLPSTGYADLPLATFGPLARMHLQEAWQFALDPNAHTEVTSRVRINEAYERSQIPVLHVAGWYDVFFNGTIQNYTAMSSRRVPNQWLIIGPWTHGNVSRVQGDVDFGYGSSGALVDLQIDLMNMQLQFFDTFLKGTPSLFSTMQPVKYFVMGINRWRSAMSWPPDYQAVPWFIGSAGHANGLEGDGALAPEVSPQGDFDAYSYDPATPVPTVGGATLLPPVFRAGPRDQTPIERRNDVLVYTSRPLTENLEISGPVSATLYVSTDAPDTDFVVRLVDVWPDGRAIPLTDGILRLGHQEPMSADSSRSPDVVRKISVDMWSTSNVFLSGHRIRLDITSSSFPRWDRNLNTGGDSLYEVDMAIARQKVFHSAECPSHIVLPVMDSGQS